MALGEPEDWRDLGPHLLSHDHADAEEEENQEVEGEYKDHASARGAHRVVRLLSCAY